MSGLNPLRPNWEVIWQPLYDFVRVEGGRQTVNLFSVPRGADKGLGDTNLDLAGQLPKGLEFQIQAVEVVPPSRSTLGLSASLCLYIGAYRYIAIPADMATGRPFALDPKAGLHLMELMSFGIEIQAFATRKTPYRLGVVLHGFQYRRTER